MESKDGSCAELNRDGICIATKKNAAYTEALQASHPDAKLVDTTDGFGQLSNGQVQAVAGLRSTLRNICDTHHMHRNTFKLASDNFLEMPQSIAVPCKAGPEVMSWLEDFVDHVIQSGFVEDLLKKHDVATTLDQHFGKCPDGHSRET